MAKQVILSLIVSSYRPIATIYTANEVVHRVHPHGFRTSSDRNFSACLANTLRSCLTILENTSTNIWWFVEEFSTLVQQKPLVKSATYDSFGVQLRNLSD